MLIAKSTRLEHLQIIVQHETEEDRFTESQDQSG